MPPLPLPPPLPAVLVCFVLFFLEQELDFLNEANNQIRMKKVLSSMKGEVFVPDVVLELSTRRVLVSEWVDGIKLTKADPSEVRTYRRRRDHVFQLSEFR